MIVFNEFINLGKHIYGSGWERHRGGVSGAKKKKQGDTNVRFRVPVMSTCTHIRLIIH